MIESGVIGMLLKRKDMERIIDIFLPTNVKSINIMGVYEVRLCSHVF